ncbi:hypothetical protein G3N61_07390, partial [Burkholderia sp. Ac-20349]|nr:hypothetical protein [Burkholderia sp. Ac-20349]
MSEVQGGAAASEAVDTAVQDKADQAAAPAGAVTEIPGGVEVDPASIPKAPADDSDGSHGHVDGDAGDAGSDAAGVTGDEGDAGDAGDA